MSNRKERKVKQAMARQATRRAIRKAKRDGGTIHDARELMPHELRKITEKQLRRRERTL
jgi:hypothetical protein